MEFYCGLTWIPRPHWGWGRSVISLARRADVQPHGGRVGRNGRQRQWERVRRISGTFCHFNTHVPARGRFGNVCSSIQNRKRLEVLNMSENCEN